MRVEFTPIVDDTGKVVQLGIHLRDVRTDLRMERNVPVSRTVTVGEVYKIASDQSLNIKQQRRRVNRAKLLGMR